MSERISSTLLKKDNVKTGNTYISMENVYTQNYVLRSFKLPVRQNIFLKNLPNASNFIREAIEEKRLRECVTETKEQKILRLSCLIKQKKYDLSFLETARKRHMEHEPEGLTRFQKLRDETNTVLNKLIPYANTIVELTQEGFQYLNEISIVDEVVELTLNFYTIHIPVKEFFKEVIGSEIPNAHTKVDFWKFKDCFQKRIEEERKAFIETDLDVQTYNKTAGAYQRQIDDLEQEIRQLKQELVSL